MFRFKSLDYLSETDRKQCELLFKKSRNQSIYQDVEYNLLATNKLRFFLLFHNDSIQAYCIAHESKLTKLNFIKTAQINFGIISTDINLEKELFNYIKNYYENNKFCEVIFDFYYNDFPHVFKDEIRANKISQKK
jgi:hypothetical protein